MYTFFLVCAVMGGTVFVIQFVIALLGFGVEGLDLADDIPDDMPDDASVAHGHGSTWLFGVISFRTIVAALAFFGVAGLAALSAGQSDLVSLLVGIAFGLAAMYGVHFLMLSLYRLKHDGTVRIERAVGKRGSVYLPIPPNNSGNGRVQIKLQGRIAEYTAVNSGPDRLEAGTPIVVVDVISSSIVEVEPVLGAIPAKPVSTSDADLH